MESCSGGEGTGDEGPSQVFTVTEADSATRNLHKENGSADNRLENHFRLGSWECAWEGGERS